MYARSARSLCLALAAITAISGWIGGAGDAALADVERPEASGRVVRVFDFDEREFNLDPVPMHWIRAHHVQGVRERPGFPNWNRSAFSDKHSRSGNESFMLPTSGGSVSARLVSGVLAAIPGSDYQIAGYVRTEGLSVARARIVARLLDAEGEEVPSSQSDSGLILSNHGWSFAVAKLAGDFPNAAWIQIDLELLQPGQFPRDERAAGMPHVEPHLVREEDLSGAAWFDDLTVRHIPRLDVASTNPTNIFVAPERPEFRFVLRDLTGDELTGELTVIDETGGALRRETVRMPPGGGELRWAPESEEYGWRRVELRVIADGVVLQSGSVSYCLVPPAREIPDGGGLFGLIAETTPPDRTTLLPELARRIGAGAVGVTVWDEWMHTGSALAIASTIEPPVDSLLDEDRAVTFALRDAPAKGDASELVGRRLIDLLGRDELWDIAIDPLVARFGQRVHAWRLGAIGDRDIVWARDVESGLRESLERLRWFAPSPRWVLPVDAEQRVAKELRAAHSFSVRLPVAAPNESVSPLVKRWLAESPEDAAEIEFVIETHPHEVYGRRAAAVGLAQRTTLAWGAGARRLSLVQPWTHAGEAPGRIVPGPELGAWKTLRDRLSGRRYAGELPIAEGVRAMIFVEDRGERSMVAAWNESAEPEHAIIQLHLGDGEISVADIFGNETALAPTEGVHTIELTDAPVFIEGVDPGLVRLHAGFRVEPAMIRSAAKLHEVELVIQNPFPTSISGRLRVVEPAEWTINPRAHRFNIGPGQEERFPVQVSFGVGELAGTKPVTLDLELSAEKDYPVITMRSSVVLGLAELAMSPTVFVDTESDRVLVTLQITNLSDRQQSIKAYVMAPGRARKSANVSNLEPNQSTIRRFIFKGDAESMRGESIRIGLLEIDGPGRLNGVVEIR